MAASNLFYDEVLSSYGNFKCESKKGYRLSFFKVDLWRRAFLDATMNGTILAGTNGE